MAGSLSFLPTWPATLIPPLSGAFSALGLPQPVEVQALRRPGALGCYLVTGVDGAQRRLTVVLTDLVGTGTNGAIIAANRLEGDEDLPVAGPVIALPIPVLGAPALLHGLPRGRPSDVIGDPALSLDALGRVLDAVSRRAQPDGGVAAGRHRFYATHGRWGEQWVGMARRWAEIARRGGAALQPMTDALLGALDEEALADEGPPVLVPAGLGPGAIWLDEAGEHVAVDGWTPTWCGDPWSAWAPLLHLPAEALARVRLAHAAPPLLAPRARRLAVYAAGHALSLLAEAAAAVGPQERCAALQRALLAFEARDSLVARLEAADGGGPAPAPVGVERALVLAVMDRLVREPLIGHAPGWLAVAGAALLAHHLAGSAELAGWVEVARGAVSLLERGAGPAPTPLAAAPLLTPQEPQAWILRWIAEELRHAAGGQAPEGMDAAIGALSWRAPPDHSAQHRLHEAVLGLAAVARLGGEGAEAMRERLVEQARESWDELDFGVPAPVVRPEATLLRYADPAAHAGLGWPVGLLLFAFARGGALPLPATPPAILAVLGVTP